MSKGLGKQIAAVEKQHRFVLHPEQFAAPGHIRRVLSNDFQQNQKPTTPVTEEVSDDPAIPYCGMTDHTRVWGMGWRAQPIAELHR